MDQLIINGLTALFTNKESFVYIMVAILLAIDFVTVKQLIELVKSNTKAIANMDARLRKCQDLCDRKEVDNVRYDSEPGTNRNVRSFGISG